MGFCIYFSFLFRSAYYIFCVSVCGKTETGGCWQRDGAKQQNLARQTLCLKPTSHKSPGSAGFSLANLAAEPPRHTPSRAGSCGKPEGGNHRSSRYSPSPDARKEALEAFARRQCPAQRSRPRTGCSLCATTRRDTLPQPEDKPISPAAKGLSLRAWKFWPWSIATCGLGPSAAS